METRKATTAMKLWVAAVFSAMERQIIILSKIAIISIDCFRSSEALFLGIHPDVQCNALCGAPRYLSQNTWIKATGWGWCFHVEPEQNHV